MTSWTRSVRKRVTSRLFRLARVAALGVATFGIIAAQSPSGGFTEEDLARNTHLTPAMRRLIGAYENYIRLYPNNPQARDYLLDEAGRFRDAGDHETGIVVLNRILARTDLSQENRAYCFDQIMDAHRVLGQFDRQEEWAYRMAVADVGAEKQQQAKDFIFLAGFNRAKALEDSGNVPEAAQAYERLAVKNPDHREAANAMLRAAVLYEDGGNKARAALTYERFYYTYPDYKNPQTGDGALVALENAATLYLELEDRRHGADAVERILAAAPEHPKRKDYLQSLAAIYQLLNDYQNAIRVRQGFIAAYPRDPLAGTFQWDIASFRGLAGQRQQALAEYENFLANYPFDFRAIEANYRVGADRLDARKKALEKGQRPQAEELLTTARRHFERAFTLHDSLVEKSGLSAGDLKNTLASIVEVARMDSATYYTIDIGRTQEFKQDSTRKWATLQKASQIYVKIAQYGYPPTTFEALYKRGRVLEDFAAQYLRQPRPDSAVTYDQIMKVFFINAVSQNILSRAAIPAYQQQMIEFYETNKAQIDTSASGIDQPALRRRHLEWIEKAKERVASIPAKVDSLELNTISYEADLLVLDAQEKIPQRFENAWKQYEQQHADRYAENPRFLYPDKQQVFDMGVGPFVYGKSANDTTASVPRFQAIIGKGSRIGESWTAYNRGRLRLVYAARSNYYKRVAYESVHGLDRELEAFRGKSEDLVGLVASLPKLDLTSLGPPPTQPDFTVPTMPSRPPGDPATWTNEQKIRLVNAFKAYQGAVQDLQYRIARYRQALTRFQERRQALIQRQTDQYKDVLQRTGAEARVFNQKAFAAQTYRITVERVFDNAVGALERDIAFGDSVGYQPLDRQAVRDSALVWGIHRARVLDSLYLDVIGQRRTYEVKRDAEGGGEGTPQFQILNTLVTGYASVADSFRASTVRAYTYVYNGRDSLFNAGLDHPLVASAIVRLRALDPTFGTQAIAKTFTYVTEDSSGQWRVATSIDKQNPEAWRRREFDDNAWGTAREGTMGPLTEMVAETAPASDTTAGGDTWAATDTTASDTLAPAPVAAAPDTPAKTVERARIAGFPERTLNMKGIWSEQAADTVFFRYKIELPPGFAELPDSLRERERPRPVVKRATITISANDDYVVYVNGEVTNARDQEAAVDWPQARTVEILKDQWFIGDTVNVVAIRARNERRVARIPDTDTTTYGLMARIDIEMDIPLDIYQILYKPPEPEPTFVLAYTHEDSVIMADTTAKYFRTAAERDRWTTCRADARRLAWEDSVLYPWRTRRVEMRIADVDSQIARTRRWLRQQAEQARVRLTEAASRELGVDVDTAPPPEAGPAEGTDTAPADESGADASGATTGGTVNYAPRSPRGTDSDPYGSSSTSGAGAAGVEERPRLPRE